MSLLLFERLLTFLMMLSFSRSCDENKTAEAQLSNAKRTLAVFGTGRNLFALNPDLGEISKVARELASRQVPARVSFFKFTWHQPSSSSGPTSNNENSGNTPRRIAPHSPPHYTYPSMPLSRISTLTFPFLLYSPKKLARMLLQQPETNY
jgi:hypothetical protein